MGPDGDADGARLACNRVADEYLMAWFGADTRGARGAPEGAADKSTPVERPSGIV